MRFPTRVGAPPAPDPGTLPQRRSSSRDAALPVRGWWLPEVAEGLGKFMWGGREAELLVPPLPGGRRRSSVDVVPYPGPAPLELS